MLVSRLCYNLVSLPLGAGPLLQVNISLPNSWSQIFQSVGALLIAEEGEMQIDSASLLLTALS